MKRVISLLLVCCFLGLALVACGNNNTKETQKPSDKTDGVETDIYGQTALNSKTDWDAMDFGGEEINILVRGDAENQREWGKEDVGDDELDLAIANRNEIVWDTLNVNVNLVPLSVSSYEDIRDATIDYITKDVDNNLHDYDIVAHFAYVANMIALRDYNANLLEKDTFPYFDFTQRCWNQTIVKNTVANNKLYAIAGDINLSVFNRAIVMWHNKDLYEKIKKDGDPADLQDVAISGRWTYTELFKWSTYYNNADADTPCGDVYGTYIYRNHPAPVPTDAVPYAWDVDLITTNADGTHKFNCIGNSKAEDAMIKWRGLYEAEGNSFNHSEGCSCRFGAKSHFVDGNVLFLVDLLYASADYNMAIREMDDKYSILPMPKYDEKQTNYGTTSADSYTLMTVIDHSRSTVKTKGEAVSAYLQYATEYSYTHVRGYYFEKIVKPKFFGLDDSDGHVTKSIKIFVTIIDNLEFYFHTVYSPTLNDVAWLFRDTTINGGTIEQKYNADKDNFEDKLYQLDKWLGLVN